MIDAYIYVWVYRVSPEKFDQFYEHYGPDGSWAVLFRQAPGYLDTLLLQDRNDSSRLFTIDRWESEGAFKTFRETFAREFEHLDRLGAQLTTEETALGEFRPPQTDPSPSFRT